MIDCASAFVLHSLIHCVLLATEGWNRPLATSWTMEHQREWLCVCVSVCEFFNCGGGGAEWCGFQLALKVKWYQNRLKEILVWCTNKAGKNKQRKKKVCFSTMQRAGVNAWHPEILKGWFTQITIKHFPILQIALVWHVSVWVFTTALLSCNEWLKFCFHYSWVQGKAHALKSGQN